MGSCLLIRHSADHKITLCIQSTELNLCNNSHLLLLTLEPFHPWNSHTAQWYTMNIYSFAGGKNLRGLIDLKGHANCTQLSLTNHCLRLPLKNNELYWILLTCFTSTGPDRINFLFIISTIFSRLTKVDSTREGYWMLGSSKPWSLRISIALFSMMLTWFQKMIAFIMDVPNLPCICLLPWTSLIISELCYVISGVPKFTSKKVPSQG